MRGRERPRLFTWGLLCLCLAGVQAAPAQVQATDKPFLWRIDGPTPSYLYGTLHVPDARVLALPEVVRRALDAADVFNAELPIDDSSRQAVMSIGLLPPGQDLKSLLGEAAFARVVRVIQKLLPAGIPPAAAERLAALLLPLKPWVAMGQVQILQFLPDTMAGRQPLDAVLYDLAAKAGKTVGGLETIDEQAAVFDAFTTDEQVRMFVGELDELEKSGSDGRNPIRQMIDLYLAGDLDRVAAEINKQSSVGDPALTQRLMTRMVSDRNLRMADRIAALCASAPARSYFFAVGTAHYVGETGILNQLTKKGFKVTRLGAADAASIVRKAAA